MRFGIPAIAAALFAVLTGCGSPAPQTRRAAAQMPAHQSRKYALLINGDGEVRHKRNILRAYQTLRKLGFEDANILVLSTEDPRTRRTCSAGQRPTLKHLEDTMDRLAGVLTSADLLVVYGTGHGDFYEGESTLGLWRDELYASELRDEVEALPARAVIVMDQCYSGGFLDAFKGTNARVISMATVDSRHETDCYYFARAFWDSFLHPEQADANHDGKTSVHEAFETALKMHKRALAGEPGLFTSGAYRAFNGFNDAVLN